MATAPCIGRLTWNSTAPAPFESGWAIFVKVLAHNYMVIGELANLIRKSEVPLKAIYPFDLSNSEWIDFEKFGKLLDVNPARLKTGFLDQLGFHPHADRYDRYKIRHCPMCTELGYHCALFDLAMVEECPWHHCKLRPACSGCGSPLTINGVSRFMKLGHPACHRCGMQMDLFLNFPNLNRLDLTTEAMLADYCAQLIGWWKLVREKTEGFPNVTEELEILDGSINERRNISSVLLGYARLIAPQPLYWTFSTSAWPAKYSEWTTTLLDESTDSPEYYSNGPIGKMYRSIRRHLYRRYVRPHRRSLCALNSLSRDATFALRGDKICITALAYVIWRMSIERMCNIEGLREPRKSAFRLRLMGPEYFRINLPAISRLRWCYLGFFGLWQKLHDWFSVYERIAIDFGEDDFCNGFLHWRHDSVETSDYGAGFVGTPVKIKIISPNPSLLDEHNAGHTNKSAISTEDLMDIPAFNTQQTWSWAIDHRSRSTVMFQFTYSRCGSKSQFMHLIV